LIIEYAEEHWISVCQVHDLARPVELYGSCDEKAYIPLAEDKNDHDNFNNSIKHVAVIGQTVVGFVGTLQNEITWLYVDPNYFGNGFGRALLKKALSNIPDAAYLYVLDGNATAIKLYQSEGFRVVKSAQEKENGYNCTVLKLSQ